MSKGPPQTDDQPLVWIVDCEQWPRANLRAELIERGYDAVGYIALAPVLSALHRASRPKPRVLVLDLRGQSVAEADFEKLAASSINVVIVGGAVELQQPGVGSRPWAAVLQRPITLGEIADAVERIISGCSQ